MPDVGYCTEFFTSYRMFQKVPSSYERTHSLLSRGSHQLELQVHFARTNSFYSFVPQTTALWNSLPKDTKICRTYEGRAFASCKCLYYFTPHLLYISRCTNVHRYMKQHSHQTIAWQEFFGHTLAIYEIW